MSNLCIIVTIVGYLAAMLLVGFAYSKSNNDSTDFYLGGRKMGPLVTAMSAEASDMSSWLLMGMPGLAYLSGIASPGWTAIGLALGTWLNWLIVARRLRRYSANLDAITVPQFLSLRFHDQRNLLNALARSSSSSSLCPTRHRALRPAASCSTACSAWITWRRCWSRLSSSWGTPSWAASAP